jgi:hydroxyacylglutathione hydrolase
MHQHGFMLFRRVKSHGVAHNSYFIADGGEALVIDPRRDIEVYLALARKAGARIRHVLETHRNEDYVIGSTAVREATGAEILHSRHQRWGYGQTIGDGDEVGAGRIRVRALETPGHTRDSLTFALIDTDTASDPVMAFTGDALFVGDTGRTDLLGDAREAAEMLHDSLFSRILPLGDGVILCPAHGGGSVCGGDISDRDLSSIGFERLHNSKLAERDREAFVRMKLAERHLQPPYFKRMEEWNLEGTMPIYPRLPVPPPRSPGELAELIADGAVVIDARMPQAFAGGHIPGSYNIWQGGLSAYLGWTVKPGARFALVLPEHVDLEEVTRTLIRIGYDEMVGYLRGGFETWQNEGREVERHETIDTNDLRTRIERGEDLVVLDVRKPDEHQEGSLDGAIPIFVGELEQRLSEVPRDRPVVSMCSVGHRGGLAASILARHGFRRPINYLGGYTAWKQTREES